MPQSSLMTWLNKPAAVKQPLPPPDHEAPASPPAPKANANANANASINGSKTPKASESSTTATFGPYLKPLPPNVELRPCGKDDIPQLKRLTSLLLPIPYPDKFYKEIIDDQTTSNITILAVWHDDLSNKGVEKGRLIGAIRCRLLAQTSTFSAKDTSPMLYLSTLILLSPYRSHGIATHMLHMLTRRAVNDHKISSVGAHVWEANTDGLEWYRKRGFRQVGHEDGYYRRLDPQGAVVMQRDVGVLDLVGT